MKIRKKFVGSSWFLPGRSPWPRGRPTTAATPPPWAANAYQAARRRGKRHPHAVRILARSWMRVLWACWQQGAPYDPDQHAAARVDHSTPAAA